MKIPVPSVKSITGGTILGGSIIGPSTVAGLKVDEIQYVALENKDLIEENQNLNRQIKNLEENINDVDENHRKTIEELERKVDILQRSVDKNKKDKEALRSGLEFYKRDNMEISEYIRYLQGVLEHRI